MPAHPLSVSHEILQPWSINNNLSHVKKKKHLQYKEYDLTIFYFFNFNDTAPVIRSLAVSCEASINKCTCITHAFI